MKVIKKFIALIIAMLLVSQLSLFQVYATETTTDEAASTESETPADAEAPADAVVETPDIVDMNFVENFTKEAQSIPADYSTIPAGFELISENEKIAFYAVIDKGIANYGELLLFNKKSGFIWRSNPIDKQNDEIAKKAGAAYTNIASAMMITYYRAYSEFKINSYTASVQPGLSECVKVANGVKYIYKFAGTEFVIPVQFTLEGECLAAKILLNDKETKTNYNIVEDVMFNANVVTISIKQTVDYNIASISLLPYMGAGGLNEKGYMFIPDGSGALVNFNNGKNNFEPYHAPVYGYYSDSTSNKFNKLTDNVKLPVFGVVKEQGDAKNALLGIITENEAVAMIDANVSGYDSAYNNVCSTYMHKLIDGSTKLSMTQPASNEIRDPKLDYVVKYYPLDGEEANYTGMARRYQRYLKEEKGLTKNKDLDDTALYLDMYAGVERRSTILGIPKNILSVMTSYKDLVKLTDDLESQGITDLVIKYSDWGKRSIRKKVASKVSFEGALGGKNEFKKTVNYLKEKNVNFYPNVDFVNYGKSGNGYNSFFDCVKYADMSPAHQMQRGNSHINLGRRWFLLKSDLVVKASNSFLKNYEKTGTSDISLETIGARVYSDSGKGGVTRGSNVSIWQDIMKNYKADGGRILVTMPNAYTLPFADAIMNVPSSQTYVEIADEAVPFYQTVLRGYVSYSSEPINLASDLKTAILKAVETGSSFNFSFVMRDPSRLKETYLNYLFSSNYNSWRDVVVKEYTKYKDVMEQISGQGILNHEKLDKDLYKITYENGTIIYVNYSEEAANVDGLTIEGSSYQAGRGV